MRAVPDGGCARWPNGRPLVHEAGHVDDGRRVAGPLAAACSPADVTGLAPRAFRRLGVYSVGLRPTSRPDTRMCDGPNRVARRPAGPARDAHGPLRQGRADASTEVCCGWGRVVRGAGRGGGRPGPVPGPGPRG